MSNLALTITVDGDGTLDDMRSLWAWFTREDELRGRVELREGPPTPGTLGSVPEALLVALGPGGAGAVVASVLITWLRQRSANVEIRASRTDHGTSIAVSARSVQGLDEAGLRRLIAEVERLVEERE
jgi:Effector Associated Constant Component 1